MDAALEKLVRQRAALRCEYRHFPEALAETPFQFDHIVPRQHGGNPDAGNLALACCHCNRYKGPNLSGIDPATKRVIRLFHPRTQHWSDHFAWDGPVLLGKTSVGRATLQTLSINRPDAILVRELFLANGVDFD